MALPTNEQITEALSKVIDPELRRNIVELGMVRSVEVFDNSTPCQQTAFAGIARPTNIEPTSIVLKKYEVRINVERRSKINDTTSIHSKELSNRQKLTLK